MAIDQNGFTTLGPKDYQKQALEIKNNFDGKNWFPEVKRLLGKPIWDDVEYKLQSTGKGNIGRKQLKKAAASKKKSGTKRNRQLKQANKLIKKSDLEAGTNKAKEIKLKGKARNADHILEVQTFGPALDQLKNELKTGAITKAEYNKRLKIFKEYKPGDHVDNIQDLHWAKNEDKRKIVAAKNKALQKMEVKNPSLRHLSPEFQKAYELTDKAKRKYSVKAVNGAIKNGKNGANGISNGLTVLKNTKGIANKGAKLAGKAIPYVGLGIAGGVVTTDVKAAVKNPSAKNFTKLALGLIDAGIEVADAATSGLSTPVTLIPQLGIEATRHYLDNGAAKISTKDRRRYRNGKA